MKLCLPCEAVGNRYICVAVANRYMCVAVANRYMCVAVYGYKCFQYESQPELSSKESECILGNSN